MFVLRKTLEAAVEAQRQIGSNAVMSLVKSYGEALNRVTALQQQLSAWVLNKAENITPEQAAQMFYAQDSRWQAAFFNCMQEQVRAHHDAMPLPRPGEWRPSAGVPAGEAQWYHQAEHLTDEGFETIEAMYEHAQHHRSRRAAKAAEGLMKGFDDAIEAIKVA